MTTLKIDFDWDPPFRFMEDWRDLCRWVLREYHVEGFGVETSPSGRGLHIRIFLREDLDDMEVLRLQFLLGDDRTRCRLNYLRLMKGIDHWNKLFVRRVQKRSRPQVEQ